MTNEKKVQAKIA